MANYENLELKKLNYNSYLKIPELLNLQKELSEPAHHDELFFIIIHQAAELWFKLMLHESKALVEAFREGSVSHALKKLKRLTSIAALEVQQIQLLNTLTPVEFAGFRDNLRPASGFQSLQFRLLEFKYGIREDFFLKFFKEEKDKLGALESVLQEPSVYDEFLRCLAKGGFAIPKELLERDVTKPWKENQELIQTLKLMYEKPEDNYHWVLLAEAMLDFDEKFALWRTTHILMVARTIGMKSGTGGSDGYSFLLQRMGYKFFPELWSLRTHLGTP